MVLRMVHIAAFLFFWGLVSTGSSAAVSGGEFASSPVAETEMSAGFSSELVLQQDVASASVHTKTPEGSGRGDRCVQNNGVFIGTRVRHLPASCQVLYAFYSSKAFFPVEPPSGCSTASSFHTSPYRVLRGSLYVVHASFLI